MYSANCKVWICASLIGAIFGATPAAFCDEPLKGNVNQSEQIGVPGYVPNYGAPKMIPVYKPPVVKPVVKPVQKPKPMPLPKPVVQPKLAPIQGTVGVQRTIPVMPRTTQAPVSDELPAEFLGKWTVRGQRSAAEAMPQFQSGLDKIFAMGTSNEWTISGSPEQGYMLSTDSGVSTPLAVERQSGQTAIIKYEHPIRNTVAREAVVLQLGAGGRQFTALERIAIIKQGEGTRAKVTYQLSGTKH